jgi:hypothetical protein
MGDKSISPIFAFVLFLLMAGLLLVSACFTYSSMQSARLVKPGQFEVTPSYSSMRFADEGKSEKVTNQFGAQLAIGMSDRFNARMRYEYVQWDDDFADVSYSFFALEPKIGLVEDVIAVSLPVGLWFGGDVEENDSWQAHPSIHMTALLNPVMEINGSAKYLYFFEQDTDDLIALNLGVGLGTMGQFVLRPEIGWLFNPDEDGHYLHYSIGFSLYSQ